MKIFSLAILGLLAFSESTCKSKKQEAAAPNCYKGRLEVKAACMNYTLSVTGGTIDTSLVQSSWTDETTGKTYKNAFALGNQCNFPATINAGDEFYFMIDSSGQQNCAVCMMYYPVPSKKLAIRIITDPCPQ